MPTVIFTGTANCGGLFALIFSDDTRSHGRLPGAKKCDGVEIWLVFIVSPARVSDHALPGAEPPQAFHDQPFNLKVAQAKRWMDAAGIELPKFRKSESGDKTIMGGREDPVFDAWAREIGPHGFWAVGSGN